MTARGQSAARDLTDARDPWRHFAFDHRVQSYDRVLGELEAHLDQDRERLRDELHALERLVERERQATAAEKALPLPRR